MNISDRVINAIQPIPTFEQTEGANLQYTINYAALLQLLTIATSTWASSSATLSADVVVGQTTKCTVTGNPGTHRVINTMTDSAGNVEKRQINIIVRGDSANTGDY